MRRKIVYTSHSHKHFSAALHTPEQTIEGWLIMWPTCPSRFRAAQIPVQAGGPTRVLSQLLTIWTDNYIGSHFHFQRHYIIARSFFMQLIFAVSISSSCTVPQIIWKYNIYLAFFRTNQMPKNVLSKNNHIFFKKSILFWNKRA